jgi:pilus assembly protein CpaB
MNGRSLFILALAIAIGLGAMILTRQALSAGRGAPAEETREVLVAARDFKEEEMLKSDAVKVVRMVKSAVPGNSYTSFKDVEGRWVKTAMMEDDIIVEKKLGPKGTPPGLVANIPKGMRAFAIDVTEQSGVSGFILPGHRVDVLRHESGDKNEHRAETILQNVLVLAAGQLFTRPEERSVQSRTVTLALKPEDIDILVSARARGQLSLALRGVNDHDVVSPQKPKPLIDPEHEKKLKLEQEKLKVEQEKRSQLENELKQLKEDLAKRSAPAPAPAPRKPMKVATIYRGLHNSQRIRIDQPAVAVLEPSEPADPPAFPEGTAAQAAVGSNAVGGAAGGLTTP